MTESQQQALVKIQDIMREHFESGICVVQTTQDGNDNKEDYACTYHGGQVTAIGLLEYQKDRLLAWVNRLPD